METSFGSEGTQSALGTARCASEEKFVPAAVSLFRISHPAQSLRLPLLMVAHEPPLIFSGSGGIYAQQS